MSRFDAPAFLLGISHLWSNFLTHAGNFFMTVADGVQSPSRPVQSTGLMERAFRTNQCQAPLSAHLLLEFFTQSTTSATPIMQPTGRSLRLSVDGGLLMYSESISRGCRSW